MFPTLRSDPRKGQAGEYGARAIRMGRRSEVRSWSKRVLVAEQPDIVGRIRLAGQGMVGRIGRTLEMQG